MQLFYTPDITLPVYTLPAEESVHAVRVLRLGRGEVLHLTDGRGRMFRALIVRPDARACEVEVVDTQVDFEPSAWRLTLAVAPTKQIERTEWLLEKATEVGTERFVPILCERSERKVIKHERLYKVITGAVKQSLKAYHPHLEEFTAFEQLVARPFEGVKLIAHCDGDFERAWIGDCLRVGAPTLILIGPEGDFSPAEIALARRHGFTGITLGGQRLRTETAGLAAVMAMHFFNKAADRSS